MKEIVKFFVEVWSELEKTTWPGFNELMGSVIIVLIVVCFFTVYLGAIDFMLYKAVGRLF